MINRRPKVRRVKEKVSRSKIVTFKLLNKLTAGNQLTGIKEMRVLHYRYFRLLTGRFLKDRPE